MIYYAWTQNINKDWQPIGIASNNWRKLNWRGFYSENINIILNIEKKYQC